MRILFGICILPLLLSLILESVNAFECYECSTDQDQDVNCENPKSTKNDELVKTCADDVTSCFTQITNGTLSRGCAPPENIMKTLWKKYINSPGYFLCSTPLCNDEIHEAEYCLSCDQQNVDCENNVAAVPVKKCIATEQQMGCFHSIDGDLVKRGCISEINDEKTLKICESNRDTCKKCMGNGCNSRQNEFHRCLFSDANNLTSLNAYGLDSKICKNYDDECFTHVLNENSTVIRGCLSDIGEPSNHGIEINSDCDDPDICVKCPTSNCNNDDIIVEMCIVCDSNFESNCKDKPSVMMLDQCPLAIKPMGCFMHQRGQYVKRGCMSADPEVREMCLDSDDDTCRHCFGNKCNEKPHFTKCRNCNNEANGEACENAPSSVKLKICPDYIDECYTYISDNATIFRGCLSEFPEGSDKCTNPETCERCSEGEHGCNDRVLDEEFCLLCSSELNTECETNVKSIQSHSCPRTTLKSQGCFHFADGTVTKRGCTASLSTKDKELALNQTDLWKLCSGNNCNSQESFTKCFECNSKTDSKCTANPIDANVTVKICDAYDDMCYTKIGIDAITRGCVGDLSDESARICDSTPNKCEKCKSTGDQICNNKKFDQATCISCDSDTDRRCIRKPSLLEQKICARINAFDKDSGCYLRNDGGRRVRRGCVSDLTQNELEMSLNDSDHFKVCDGNNCNEKVNLQECYSCTSRDDPECSNESPSHSITVCPNYMDKCLTGIDQDGFTVRKCIPSNYADTDEFSQFKICNTHRCNVQSYPQDRLQCLQCDGSESCNSLLLDDGFKLQSSPCRIYSEHDKCFTYLDEEQNLHRGCQSDFKESRLLCEQNEGSCVKCDENECNNRPLYIEPELSCHVCLGSDECAYGQVPGDTVQNCTQPVKFGLTESCFVNWMPDSNTVKRGCTLDETDEDANWCTISENCETCEEDDCNIENIYFSYCLQCNSAEDKYCKSPHPKDARYNNKCASANEDDTESDDDSVTSGDENGPFEIYTPYPFSKRGCYTYNRNGSIERGCVADMSEDEHDDCDKSKDCNICLEEYCNDKQYKSAASALISYIPLLIVLLTLNAC